LSYLSDWQYRKKITIQGQSGAGTDYQVLLKVGESSGASGYDFHVEGHSSNFPSDTNQSGDLRFTKSDGTTLLNFWVEKVEGTSPNRVAYCWIKITDNLDSNVDIYCYYGNSNAGNVSSVTNTFIREISNLKGAWHCDENSGDTVEDSSGNNHDGTKHGATWTDGKFGNALNFDGNDYVDLGDILDDVFAGADKKFSFSVWVKPSAQMTNNHIIVKLADSGCSEDQRQFVFRLLTDSKPEFMYYCGLSTFNYRGILGSTPITDLNKWYHLIVTYDGSIDTNNGLDRVKIYVDGQAESTTLDYSGGSLGDIQNGTAHLGFGVYLNSSGSPCGSAYFNGIMDEIFIFDKVLTAEEVSDLYNNYGYTTTSYSGKVLVRKRVDPEPSFSSSSLEEESFKLYDIDICILEHKLSCNYSVDICVAKQGWLPYNFRRQITIDNTSNSNNLIDYQVKIILNSDNFNFNHAKDDGSDIAFADSNGTSVLYHWKEKWDKNNQEAILWVKVPSIPASSTKTIYLYYGNSEAEDSSDGDNTFDFFDDFIDTIDTNKWNIKGNSDNLDISNSVLDIYISEHTGDGNCISNGIVSKTYTIETGHILEALVKGDSQRRNYWVFVGANDNEGAIWGSTSKQTFCFYQNTEDDTIANSWATDRQYTCITIDYSNWHRYRIDYIDTNTLKFYIDDDLKATHTGTAVPDASRKLELGGDDYSNTNYHVKCDWIRVRKYTDPVPSSTIGSEQTVKEINYSIDAIFTALKQDISIDLLLQKLQSLNYDCDVIIKTIEKIYNIDTLLQKIKFFNYNVDTLIEKIINQYYNVNVLLESLKSSTYILDILIKKLKYINYNLDILLQKFSSINYNIDLIIEEITKKSYSANVLLKALKQESYISDVLLQKFNSINYDADLILNKIGQSQYSIDLILQTEEGKSEYNFDVFLKGILNLNYQSDVLLKLLKLIDYDIDVPLEKLQSFVYDINAILNKLESITYDNDILLEQLQSFNYDIDILLKQLSSSIYDINVLFRQLQTLIYNIDVIIKIIEKQISIDVILSEINEFKYSIDVSLFQKLRFAPCKLILDYNKYNLNLDFQCNKFNLDFACQEE